jgi:hypothetical protein
VTKNLSQDRKDQIKDLIIQTVKKDKPKTEKQLIALMQERYTIPPEQTTSLIIELENEDRLHFIWQEPSTLASAKEYIFSKQAAWYWTTIAFATVTAIAVFAIPEGDVPLSYLRFSLGIIFVLFLPGFMFTKALFPAKVPIKTFSENMDTIKRVALSFGMSLALLPIVGLILNFTRALYSQSIATDLFGYKPMFLRNQYLQIFRVFKIACFRSCIVYVEGKRTY